MGICILWGEIKADMCFQEPALVGGWRCYLQALADIPSSGRRLIPQTEAFTGPQRICFQKLPSEQSSQVHFGRGHEGRGGDPMLRTALISSFFFHS